MFLSYGKKKYIDETREAIQWAKAYAPIRCEAMMMCPSSLNRTNIYCCSDLVELSYPGVYIVEVPPIARAITAASTSTAAFIGMAEKGPVPEKEENGKPKGKPPLVTSFTDFVDKFGSFTTKKAMRIPEFSNNDVYLPYAVWAFFQNGGRQCYILRLAPEAKAATYAVPGDGGDPAFTMQALSPGVSANDLTVSVRKGTMSTEQRPTYKIDINERTIVRESWEVSMKEGEDDAIDTVINNNSKYIKILEPVNYDSKPELNPTDEEAGGGGGNGGIATGGGGTALILEKPGYKLGEQIPGTPGRDVEDLDIVNELTVDISALETVTDVSLIAAPGYTNIPVINAGFEYAESHRNGLGDAFFIADVPPLTKDINAVKEFISSKIKPNINGYGALYFPWVQALDRIAKGRDRKISLPPSGFIAGICAKTDNIRGVWKAPAGTEAGVAGALDLDVILTDREQGVINLAGVNALRSFPGYGPVVWGARTVSRDIAWRYVPVRRMANFLKSSIYDGIQWAVFEPNDEPLWAALRLNIGGFMLDLFKRHALQGSTPEQAFFVKCDNETTTERDQQLGIVNVLVGFAPLKPAEFVVVHLSQKVAQQKT